MMDPMTVMRLAEWQLDELRDEARRRTMAAPLRRTPPPPVAGGVRRAVGEVLVHTGLRLIGDPCD